MKKESSKAIALAGIGSSISLIAVVLAVYVEFATLSFYAVSAIGIMMPLTRGFYKSAWLSYVAVSLLSLPIAGVIQPLPFIFFFGFHINLMYMLDYKFAKIKLNKWLKYSISYAIKIGFCNLSLFAVVSLMKIVVGEIVILSLAIKYYWLLALLGTIAFVAYDILMQIVFKNLCAFVNRYIYKTKIKDNKKDKLDKNNIDNNSLENNNLENNGFEKKDNDVNNNPFNDFDDNIDDKLNNDFKSDVEKNSDCDNETKKDLE